MDICCRFVGRIEGRFFGYHHRWNPDVPKWGVVTEDKTGIVFQAQIDRESVSRRSSAESVDEPLRLFIAKHMDVQVPVRVVSQEIEV